MIRSTNKQSLEILLKESNLADGVQRFNSSDLEQLFGDCFFVRYNTVLVGGAMEPEYLPSGLGHSAVNKLFYREDFFASAMHEIAHWCIAGVARRGEKDFGYWYEEDGRNLQQQSEFEKVEIKPQALECLFLEATGFQFKPSVDNIAVNNEPSKEFLQGLSKQIHIYLDHMPKDADIFLSCLLKRYKQFNSEKEFYAHMCSVTDILLENDS